MVTMSIYFTTLHKVKQNNFFLLQNIFFLFPFQPIMYKIDIIGFSILGGVIMKFKKITSIALVVVMTAGLFSAAACKKTEPAVSEVPTSEVITSETSEPVSEEAPKGKEVTLATGDIVIDDHFDEGVGSWMTYSNGGDFSISNVDGELCVDIVNTGKLDYSCQVFRDEFTMFKDAVYEMQFDIHSDIDRLYQWRIQINGGDYHAYVEETEQEIGPEVKHVCTEFTMEEDSDPAPRFCFNLGLQGDLEQETAHKVYIDNIVLTVKDASNAIAPEPLPDPVPVRVNQIGYESIGPKFFVTKYRPGVTEFTVHNADTDAVVYTGKFPADPTFSTAADEQSLQGEFSDLKDKGTYYINVDGVGKSYNFIIGDNIYADAYKDVVRLLTLQRCGMEMDAKLAGDFAHPICHTEVATIYGTAKTKDVSGGWHDAGDYGRYVVAGAKTIKDLFLSYNECEAARGDDYDIPESGNGVPDILDEARYELEFFLKMQDDNGGVYHKVSTAVFCEEVMPEEDTEPLIISPISTAATGDFAAVMAEASVIYKDYDAAFAGKCLDAAKKAYGYLEKNAMNDKTGFVNPEDITTGEYPDPKVKDEYFWACVELFLATGDSKYEDKALEVQKAGFPMGLGWADVGTYGAYDYLLYAKDKTGNTELTTALKSEMDKVSAKEKRGLKYDVYFISLGNGFPWGSNMTVANNAMYYQMMYNLYGDEELNFYANHALDYIFGVNPVGYCYVSGYGTVCPEHPHHRPSQSVGKAMPGMVAGGANSNPADPYATAVLMYRKNGKKYVDNATSFSTNEITIYWNSPVIYLLSYHAKLYDLD